MADGDLALLLALSHHLPLSMRKDTQNILVPSDPPENLTVGEHSTTNVYPLLCVTVKRAPLSVSHSSILFFIRISRFCSILQNSYLLLLSSKFGELNFVTFSEMSSFD